MTKEKIIELAKEAGFEYNSLGMTYTSGYLIEYLECFAKLIAEKEREECAKICENWSHANGDDCAESIRARGQE